MGKRPDTVGEFDGYAARELKREICAGASGRCENQAARRSRLRAAAVATPGRSFWPARGSAPGASRSCARPARWSPRCPAVAHTCSSTLLALVPPSRSRQRLVLGTRMQGQPAARRSGAARLGRMMAAHTRRPVRRAGGSRRPRPAGRKPRAWGRSPAGVPPRSDDRSVRATRAGRERATKRGRPWRRR